MKFRNLTELREFLEKWRGETEDAARVTERVPKTELLDFANEMPIPWKVNSQLLKDGDLPKFLWRVLDDGGFWVESDTWFSTETEPRDLFVKLEMELTGEETEKIVHQALIGDQVPALKGLAVPNRQQRRAAKKKRRKKGNQ